MTNRILDFQRNRATLRHLRLRHKRLVYQHISNRTDIRISIKLRIAAFLPRQIPRLRQIVHDLMNVSWNRLRNLETKPNANTEHIIRTEILNRILAGERLIGSLDGNSPPSAGTFWMVGENREEDIGIDALRLRIRREIDDIVGKIRNRIVIMQPLQHR